MDDIQLIRKELEEIKERNKKVTVDKAWETSLFRKGSIAIVTYIIATIVMYFIGVQDYLQNALIPTVGYILSTLSLPIIKSWWINKYQK
jgi:uncharacterized membrane protein